MPAVPGFLILAPGWPSGRPTRQMWQDHFWFGVGPAHFDYRYPEYHRHPGTTQPHNDYLNLLADCCCSRRPRSFRGRLVQNVPACAGRRRIFAFGVKRAIDTHFLCASGGLCSLAVHSAADFNLHIPANALVGADPAGAHGPIPLCHSSPLVQRRPAGETGFVGDLGGGGSGSVRGWLAPGRRNLLAGAGGSR